MLDIKTFDDVRGNNVIIYSIRKLIERKSYPKFSILAGHMGVGKSTVAKLIAQELNSSELEVKVFNFGLKVNMEELDSDVFKMRPAKPRAFIFEELHGLDKAEQTALLTMLDKQQENTYIICTTTELIKVLRTIRSRATVWDFKLLSERQLSQLLDDYLGSFGVNLTKQAKSALLKSCFGVPRDLLKNADLAISGDFNADQLNELLGRVSEDLIFTVLCSLKSNSVDFSLNITALMSGSEHDKLAQCRDFYTRFLLERRGLEGATLAKEKITTLNSLYSDDELEKIGRTLIRATPSTLLLELSLLNMEFTRTSVKGMVGTQLDRLSRHEAKASASSDSTECADRMASARVTAQSLKNFKL